MHHSIANKILENNISSFCLFALIDLTVVFLTILSFKVGKINKFILFGCLVSIDMLIHIFNVIQNYNNLAHRAAVAEIDFSL